MFKIKTQLKYKPISFTIIYIFERISRKNHGSPKLEKEELYGA